MSKLICPKCGARKSYYAAGCRACCAYRPTPTVNAGDRFGRWTVVDYVHGTKTKPAKAVAVCDCGTRRLLDPSRLIKETRSCGCLANEMTAERSTKHGGCGTVEYNSWMAMKARCYNPGYRYFHRYGGRGISVCDRWLSSFDNFLADMGRRPARNYSLDRIDNDGDYEPGNCQWSTQITQIRNSTNVQHTIVEICGESHPLSDWASLIGIDRENLRKRINKGMVGFALLTPPKNKGRRR